MTEPFFEILDTKNLHDGFIKLDIFTVRQKLMRGGATPPITREIAANREVSAVLLYDPDRDQVVLIQQARLVAQLGGFQPISTEVVAGLIEPGESPEELAHREVAEEAGCAVIGPLLPIQRLMMSSGNLHQPVNLYCGRVDAGSAGGYHGLAEEHEDIRVLVLDFDRFRDTLLAGGYDHALVVVAGYWLLTHRDALRTRWPVTAL
ncbi:MAG TPA: NUDIX domain-containing protein [Stellaceae bacterium]|jgi:ADP-ribose pyrophosphatase|nr:NUDIX domain-containing protein [Stellaceae bacterium]